MTVLILASDWKLLGKYTKKILNIMGKVLMFPLPTEYNFRTFLEDYPEAKIDVAILSLMGVWVKPEEMESTTCPAEPEDVIEGGVENMGIRCARLLRQSPFSKNAKIIFLDNLANIPPTFKNELEEFGVVCSAFQIGELERTLQNLISVPA